MCAPAVEAGMMVTGNASLRHACTMEGNDGKNCFDWRRERRVYAQSV